MTKEKLYAITIGFLAAAAFSAIAYAYTQDQIWNSVFDSATSSIKVVVTS